jgi:hypothetical protein
VPEAENVAADAEAATASTRASDAGTSPRPAAAPKASAPAVVAFVFDRLTPNARKIAHKAALTYVDHGHVPGDLVGVFAIDLALHTLQPFSNDLGRIRDGLRGPPRRRTRPSLPTGRSRGAGSMPSIGPRTAWTAWAAAARGRPRRPPWWPRSRRST